MTEPPQSNRESWSGWISNKVATAEAALSTAFVPEPPTRAHTFHNLRAVAKANRLAKHSSHLPKNDTIEKRVVQHEEEEEEEEVLPPLTRRASAIDVTLSHAWHAVRTAAVAAMATFDQPEDATQQPTSTEKVLLDATTEISDVTISASCSSADLAEHNHDSSTCDEHPRISTTLCSHHVNTEQDVLNEVSISTLNLGEATETDDKVHELPPRKDECEECDETTTKQLNEMVDDFNKMFEQNGGAECVARVKDIGDASLEGMREPQTLNEAVEKELNEAKLKLDETLQRLESAVRSKATGYAENWDACVAAEGVIEETKENGGCGNSSKWKAILLHDCTRLVAVFASKICGSILDRVESDKEEKTWNERVEKIGWVSEKGIARLRIIAKRFVEAVEGDGKNVARICKVADAGVERVVQCVALAVAALQVEVCERAYECCG